jgi:hypothetical protein
VRQDVVEVRMPAERGRDMEDQIIKVNLDTALPLRGLAAVIA